MIPQDTTSSSSFPLSSLLALKNESITSRCKKSRNLTLTFSLIVSTRYSIIWRHILFARDDVLALGRAGNFKGKCFPRLAQLIPPCFFQRPFFALLCFSPKIGIKLLRNSHFKPDSCAHPLCRLILRQPDCLPVSLCSASYEFSNFRSYWRPFLCAASISALFFFAVNVNKTCSSFAFSHLIFRVKSVGEE